MFKKDLKDDLRKAESDIPKCKILKYKANKTLNSGQIKFEMITGRFFYLATKCFSLKLISRYQTFVRRKGVGTRSDLGRIWIG